MSRVSTRDVLCGVGPFPDRYVDADVVDSLGQVVGHIARAERAAVFGELLALFGDDDVAVRSGAVFGLDAVPEQWDARRMLDARDRHAAALAVAPVGPRRGLLPLLAHEVLIRAASAPALSENDLARITPFVTEPELRGALVVALASSVPDVVVANAATWGRVDETGPLFRLPRHEQRLRYAAALRPWSPAAIERLAHGERVLGWTPAERAELAATMR